MKAAKLPPELLAPVPRRLIGLEDGETSHVKQKHSKGTAGKGNEARHVAAARSGVIWRV